MTNTQKQNKSSLISRLNAAVNKVRLLLSSTVLSRTWHAATVLRRGSMSKRHLSFNDDRPGLILYTSEETTSESDGEGCSSRELHRTISFPSSSSSDDDIDKRAEAFIANFRKQLRMERQISLQLRYCRQPSFESTKSP